MNKVFLIIFITLIFSACRTFDINNTVKSDRNKYDFIFQVMKDPDNYKKYAKENYIECGKDFNLENDVLERIKQYQKEGWYIICEYKTEYLFERIFGDIYKLTFIHMEKIRGEKDDSNDDILEFCWILENNRWGLYEIILTPNLGCKGSF